LSLYYVYGHSICDHTQQHSIWLVLYVYSSRGEFMYFVFNLLNNMLM
jgi:hypothetical protein